MLGVLVNFAGIVIGGCIGLLLKKSIPEKVFDTLFQAIGLCVVFIGIQGALKGENTLILLISMVIGTIIGTATDLAGRFERGSDRLMSMVRKTKTSEVTGSAIDEEVRREQQTEETAHLPRVL